MKAADGVLLVGSPHSERTKWTLGECHNLRKPVLQTRYSKSSCSPDQIIQLTKLFLKWANDYRMDTVFITGGQESDNFGIQGFLERVILTASLEMYHPGTLPDEATESELERKRRLRKERRLARRAERSKQ